VNSPQYAYSRNMITLVVRGLVAVSLIALPGVVSAAQNAERHIGNRELRIQKHGRVVDAQSGLGVPDVNVIVSWRTTSSGLAGFYAGGTWCDLQKIVTTDVDGNYVIPDVSSELDLSDRGTHGGMTPAGSLSVKHDSDWVLGVFKPGYVRAGDIEALKHRLELARAGWVGSESFLTVPDASIKQGKVEVKPIALQKVELEPGDLWSYYSTLLLIDSRCSDRMARDISQAAVLDQSAQAIVSPMPCALPVSQRIEADALGAFISLTHPGQSAISFYKRIKLLDGSPTANQFDPSESINTTAGTLCRAQHEEDTGHE